MPDLLLLAAGLMLLLGGGDVLVRGAAGLALQLGVSTLLIGLTVVALGTSAPELAVNLQAAYHGATQLSFGNIVGSNIANIGLIVGGAALLRPLVIQRSFVTREIPMMLLATAATMVVASDRMLGNGADRIGRSDGLLLVLFLLVFVYYTVGVARRQRAGSEPPDRGPAEQGAVRPRHAWWPPLAILLGLGGVLLGADFTVRSSVAIARSLGMPQVVIGLTVVAIGTSLPELATTIMALRRGHTDLVVGNAVGSNILNLLLILGVTSTTREIPIPPGGHVDLLVMAAASLALLPLCLGGQRRIVRAEGVLLLMVYGSYIAWRVLTY